MHNRHQPYAASVEAGFIRRRIHHFKLHEQHLAECNNSVTFLLEETYVLGNLTDIMCWEWSQRIYYVVGVNAHPGEIQERCHFKNRKIKVLKLMPCALYNTQYFKLISLETSLPLSLSPSLIHKHIHTRTNTPVLWVWTSRSWQTSTRGRGSSQLSSFLPE